MEDWGFSREEREGMDEMVRGRNIYISLQIYVHIQSGKLVKRLTAQWVGTVGNERIRHEHA